jgi:cysteine synthase A
MKDWKKNPIPPPDRLARDILATIGETPLVELGRMTRGLEGTILAKLEYFSPGLSKKDRVALQIIEDAEASGELLPGQTVVELTSGNTGTGLAIVCGIKGYPFVAVMSRGNSHERARMMAALGAEVVLVDQAPGSEPGQVSGADLLCVEERTREIVVSRRAFRADQFSLPGNFRAHYLHTGPEIFRQSGGQVDMFCDFAGTGGSFGGVSKALKEANPDIRCYLVEPSGCAVLAGKTISQANHRIQGGGYSRKALAALETAPPDGFLEVTDEEAIQTARDLARKEGIFAGFSSGANVCAAQKLLQGEGQGKTIVVLCCDSGLKYFSTDLWG